MEINRIYRHSTGVTRREGKQNILDEEFNYERRMGLATSTWVGFFDGLGNKFGGVRIF